MARELAILVTAKNMASGVLKDVRGDVKGIQSEAKRAASNTAKNLGIASVAAAGIIAVQVKAGFDSLAELEKQEQQTAAVLKSTGGAAGVTAAQVRKLAEEYENLTTVDDKAIQNTENLLLTFTNIKSKAFEPALQTVLDMNAAMGGDENSLKDVAIQVGKALNDPITGANALRRVGVSLTKQQQDEIKTLVKQNKLYDAQKIVLAELSKEFGGSGEAFGKGAAADMRRFADAVEGAQQALATAFLPLIEKVSKQAQTFLADPTVLRNIETFGQELAGGLDDAITVVEKIPWDAVGSAFGVMGTGAKALLTAFSSLPPWVQTAVLTGWGLNKLTGGSLGNIVGQLGSGLIKGVLGMNAGVVNIKAGVVNGGGPGGGPGGLKGPGGLLAGMSAAELGTLAAAIALPIVMFDVIPKLFPGKEQAGAGAGSQPSLNTRAGKLDSRAVAEITGLMPSFRQAAAAAGATPITGQPLAAPAGTLGSKPIPVADPILAGIEKRNASEYNRTITGNLARLSSKVTAGIQSHAATDRQDSQREQARIDGVRAATQRGLAANLARLDGVRATAANIPPALSRIEGVERGQSGSLHTIAHKNFSPSFTAIVNATFNATTLRRQLSVSSYTTASGRVGGSLV